MRNIFYFIIILTTLWPATALAQDSASASASASAATSESNSFSEANAQADISEQQSIIINEEVLTEENPEIIQTVLKAQNLNTPAEEKQTGELKLTAEDLALLEGLENQNEVLNSQQNNLENELKTLEKQNIKILNMFIGNLALLILILAIMLIFIFLKQREQIPTIKPESI